MSLAQSHKLEEFRQLGLIGYISFYWSDSVTWFYGRHIEAKCLIEQATAEHPGILYRLKLMRLNCSKQLYPLQVNYDNHSPAGLDEIFTMVP
jgi:hypothetical protein